MTTWECARCGSSFSTNTLLKIHQAEPHHTDEDERTQMTTQQLDVVGDGVIRMKDDLLRYLAYRENCKADFRKMELWTWFHRLEGMLAAWTLLNDQIGAGTSVYIDDAVDAAWHLRFDLINIKERIRAS